MAATEQTLKQRWQTMKPRNRMIAVFGGAGVAILGVSIMLAPEAPPIQKKKPLSQVELGLPGAGRDLSIEKLSASMEAVQQAQHNLQGEFKATQTSVTQQLSKPAVPDPELQALKDEVGQLKGQISKQNTSLDDALPTGNTSHDATVPATADDAKVQPDAPELPKFRVVDDGYQQPESPSQEAKKESPAFLPAGSNFEGVLLNGMDAPTSGFAAKNPVPAVMRVKTDAILPNRYRYDVSECFVVVSGYGVLSTERAQLQTTTLSCVKHNGMVVEAKIEGYVVGEDGKVGLRGRLVSKQGSLIAKTLISGFLSGIANGVSPIPVTPLNINPGSTQMFQSPNLSSVMAAGTAQGVSQSAKMISQMYLDMAKEMFPVIEIDANRRATIMLVRGTELNFSEVGK